MQTLHLAKLEISIPTSGTGGVQAGDQLIIAQSGSDKVIDLGFTSNVTDPADHMVDFGGTTFSALLTVAGGGKQLVTLQPSHDVGGTQTQVGKFYSVW